MRGEPTGGGWLFVLPLYLSLTVTFRVRDWSASRSYYLTPELLKKEFFLVHLLKVDNKVHNYQM